LSGFLGHPDSFHIGRGVVFQFEINKEKSLAQNAGLLKRLELAIAQQIN
jgi:hypothetical protein